MSLASTSTPGAAAPPADLRAAAHELAQEAKLLSQKVTAEVGRVVVGAEDITRQLLIAMLAGGHVLLEGVPGVAKTTISKVFSRLLGCQYQRVQFTPDLLPSDVTGTSIFDRNKNDFVLRKGPIFTQVLLADEINRAPAKTQAALLEAMQEHQVTVDGETIPLTPPFLVMATQNPVEQEGVYRLPEAQLDRFLLRVEMGYPGHEHEVNLLKLHSKPVVDVPPMFTPETILNLQRKLPGVYGADTLYEYIVELAERSREHPDVALGASPRASLNLLRCARARAVLEGRHFFTHEDVQAVAFGVLGHRLILRPEAEIEGKRVADIVRELLEAVPVMETV
ncbi:ATPase family associated with various cellular activities (AAA) [Gemmata obscuriglobus]|uniref:MoxR family ATPase n=1 Tax=Gemmata obscuriglobus TaxID=114 RepID=A0A2Z3H7K2_9BACT|nr:MoxR family ATPase [Gemmata obscuriglobus]AWM39556.1 MoxR family ATPase [Gemmata obscuriglobus]QEG27351.1 ATPase family associated with various cellular activities (AAA) [Gemmata obscuriglobus]VTS04217.1 magnesium chelatase : ATPase associated with various cellular activities AAA_3 OS=Haliangium ochraceum (strain DSM 14365 / JCM 11303 / SMP-2) GN=Hoch_2374 PE=4 SV=1: AAA_3 [Gemmata obscuriglobus UQM 2246]